MQNLKRIYTCAGASIVRDSITFVWHPWTDFDKLLCATRRQCITCFRRQMREKNENVSQQIKWRLWTSHQLFVIGVITRRALLISHLFIKQTNKFNHCIKLFRHLAHKHTHDINIPFYSNHFIISILLILYTWNNKYLLLILMWVSSHDVADLIFYDKFRWIHGKNVVILCVFFYKENCMSKNSFR